MSAELEAAVRKVAAMIRVTDGKRELLDPAGFWPAFEEMVAALPEPTDG